MGFADVMGWIHGFPPLVLEIPNKGWETGDAGGWTFVHNPTTTVTVRSVDPRSGVYHLAIEDYLTGAGFGYAYYRHPDYKLFAGKTIEFSTYNKIRTGYGVGVNRYIQIDDGVAASQQILQGGSGQYNKTTVQHTMDAAPTMLEFRIYVDKGSTGTFAWYFDDMDAKIV